MADSLWGISRSACCNWWQLLACRFSRHFLAAALSFAVCSVTRLVSPPFSSLFSVFPSLLFSTSPSPLIFSVVHCNAYTKMRKTNVMFLFYRYTVKLGSFKSYLVKTQNTVIALIPPGVSVSGYTLSPTSLLTGTTLRFWGHYFLCFLHSYKN